MRRNSLPGAIAFTPPRKIMTTLSVLGILGAVVFLVGLVASPHRIWGGYLVAFNYLTGLGIAGGVFLAVLSMSGAAWATALRRIPEAMTATVPVAGLLGLVLLFGLHSLYEWSHESVVAGDPVLQGKSAYLNVPGFSLRLLLFFAVWILLLRLMVRRSQAQDRPGVVADPKRDAAFSAVFMVVFCITFSLASFDWLMSLEPHWFSTIFALYRLAGIGLAGMAVVIIFVVTLRRGPLRRIVTESHLQDLGRITMSLSVFWAYIWYCQYMLIWYTNIPEETTYYLLRGETPWNVLSRTSLVLNWLLPFLVLLPRAACRSETVLLRVAVVLLVGHALDLFLQVAPPLMGDTPAFGLWELGPLVAAVAVFFLVTLKALGTASLVPERDPRLEQSLTYHS